MDLFEARLADDCVQELREELAKNEDTELALPQLPLLDANPLLPIVTGETRRRGGGILSSEYDIAQAIQLSERTFVQEDAKRKKQESTAKFDPAKECTIPVLCDDDAGELEGLERSIEVPRFVPDRELRLHLMLEPLPDDFTLAEHEVLLKNFEDHPKKWGKLAQAIGGRDFKQCINHYYSSKWKGAFKGRMGKPKGRSAKGKRASQPKTKANALMSNLGDANHTDPYEGDEFMMPNTAVTDSGRPRRAAAPTFGDKEAEETATSAATAAKKKATATTEEKQARKARTGVKEKVSRKPRTSLATRRASMSPMKIDTVYPAQTPAIYDNDVAMDRAESGYMMPWPGMAGEQQHHMPQEPAPDPSTYYSQDGSVPVSTPIPLRKPGMSSYWSVHEVAVFKQLVHERGPDWAGIALALGTKTAVMVR